MFSLNSFSLKVMKYEYLGKMQRNARVEREKFKIIPRSIFERASC